MPGIVRTALKLSGLHARDGISRRLMTLINIQLITQFVLAERNAGAVRSRAVDNRSALIDGLQVHNLWDKQRCGLIKYVINY